jgi:hypothetical protein
MPVVGSNSIAISATCHRYGDEGVGSGDMEETEGKRYVDAELPLMYGVTEVTSDMRGRVGFSDDDVMPLEDSWTYEYPEGPKGVKEAAASE